jgi:two-component system, chemotaxis family, CheB/CheR fusion protein
MIAEVPKSDFHIAGVGASAGGLDALERFFSHAPANSGVAYVIVQHLSPDYKSLMADLLSKRTTMPVQVAGDGMLVEPNHVYLIPPKQSLTIFHRKLYLTKREAVAVYLPIDIFLHSLAEDLEEQAIGIILSGTGSDGTRGIRAIKEKGGLVMVQDERSAKFDGMPRSAIATSLVDYVLEPENMVQEIVNYLKHPCLANDPAARRFVSQDDDNLSKIYALIRSIHGIDFTDYKQNTLLRRIERRMSIKQVGQMSDYLHLLYQTPSELETLYREFLIGVTRFFRDPTAFDVLREQVIPTIFEGKKRGDTIRVWSAACSTGEEAYSLAILLTDYMETQGQHMDVKVFATDLDKNALEIAGKGIYPESIAADVGPEYLQNYFIKNGDVYTVSRRIREMVIFAQQNMVSDPPFSKMDLISCRNVLIYLQSNLQKKVISSFQFALNPNGFLFLGSSETLGDAESFFQSINTRAKIYQIQGNSSGRRFSLHENFTARPRLALNRTIIQGSKNIRADGRMLESIQHGIINAFLPAIVVVDENLDIIYSTGELDSYLRVPGGGMFTANILKQAREGLAIPISTAIHKVFKEQQEVTYKNIQIINNEQNLMISIQARPYTDSSSRHRFVLILFSEAAENIQRDPETVTVFDVNDNSRQRIQDLEHELQYTRESLQATVEELETSNEELQATNEELFASNEELQSTNEELHSVNEELITVNAEYHAKIQELSRLNEDMNNLLDSVDAGIIFLDRDLHIRLFTPAAQHEIHLLEQDIGRPISHVNHTLIDFDLVYHAQQVLKTLQQQESEVQNINGRWYQIKLSPYYTLQQQVGGVILSLIDINAYKTAIFELHKSERYHRLLVASLPDSAVFLFDHDLRFLVAGGEEIKKAGFDSAAMIGASLQEALPEELVDLLKKPYKQTFQGRSASFEHRFMGQTYQQKIVPVRDENNQIYAGLVVSHNISERIEMQKQLQLGLEKYQALFASFPYGITVADKSGRILESNRAAARILGLSRAEQERRRIDGIEWQIVRPDGSRMPSDEYASVRALRENRLVKNVEMGIVKENKKITWIKVTAAPFGEFGVVITYEPYEPKPRRKSN